MTPAFHELPLFDVSRTTSARCVVCGAEREPGDPRALECLFDRDRSEYGVESRRPKRCLNTVDPATTQIPY